MNHDLKDIAEKNFELFDVLRNASAVQVDGLPINQIRLNELIIKILNQNVNNETENDHFQTIQRTSTAKFSPEFANSQEFKAFISRFIGKLKSLTVDDLFSNKDNGNSSGEEVSSQRNQVLEPPSQQKTEIYKIENRRIYRGETTNIMSYPFVVSIHVRGEFTCAGSIIGVDLVITAASCLKLQDNTYVRLNSDYYSRFGDLIPVMAIYIYPQYDSKFLHHNLAILRLQRSLKTSRISLDRGNLNLIPKAEVTILGWGAMTPNQTVNQINKLAYDVLTAYDIEECKEIYSKAYVTGSNFCAGFKTRGSGACTRDVGGPGVIDNLLFGVVSFAAPVCGDPDAPTVFTRVGFYIKWIDYIMSLRPSQREIEPNIKSEDNRGYYNTPLPLNYPHVNLFNEYHVSDPIHKSLRISDDNAQEDKENTAVLLQIINDMNNRNQMVYDIINDDLYDDFVSIFKPEYDESILHHPLINKTQLLISGIHYNVPAAKLPTAATPKYIPTFMLHSTPAEILRQKKGPK
ncbi:unnamed protein product [Arctia plantaginis]|uniref:Peptidase S1 domain-containing protein n=1 Tax=Arctia plantaginis TaxID=874455 RepID=A0A8S1AN77_ARCPL|nr:unnamed protein product [Arctia plantaginis]